MEASALQHTARLPALAGRSPLLRLQSDERLIALIRRGHHGAFEALVHRYQPRLLAFCRHMLGSQEDAEDVLQEVFAASFNAICADARRINARPWLYRIARNRCLNHLRRPVAAGQDTMDVFERDGGTTTADTVHKREEFRQIVSDVQDLPETQRTALLLREIDALSYDQIAEAMDTTVSSIKSLLVRARVSLAEAAEARLLTCEEVRLELGQVAEGLAKTSAPVRRHLRSCERCRTFKSELRKTTRALAAVYPIGPLVVLKKLALGKIGASGAAGAAAGGGGQGAASALGGAAAGGVGAGAGGAISAGAGALATKAVAGFAAAALVTAGAVEVRHVTHPAERVAAVQTVAPPRPAAPVRAVEPVAAPVPAQPKKKVVHQASVASIEPTPAAQPVAVTDPAPHPPVAPLAQEDSSTVTLPPREDQSHVGDESASPVAKQPGPTKAGPPVGKTRPAEPAPPPEDPAAKKPASPAQ
jgi:RNA polymerase sigma factor (sigma-70 family)